MDFVIPNAWEAAGLLCKFFLYLAVAALAGTALNLRFYADGSRQTVAALLFYALLAALLGFHAVLVNYLVQVGQIGGNGLTGMFDLDMARLLLDTPVGASTLWRLTAFTFALIGVVIAMSRISTLSKPPSQRLQSLIIAVPTVAVLILAYSFRLSGHVSVHGTLAQAAITLHILAFAAWIGSLYPLLRLTCQLEGRELAWFMSRFGDHARVILVVLVGSGLGMLFALLGTVSELWTSAYGQALMLKFLLVTGLLAVAAHNRFRLVPQLAEAGSTSQSLRKSIAVEMLLALLILLVTAYLSSLIGPMEH